MYSKLECGLSVFILEYGTSGKTVMNPNAITIVKVIREINTEMHRERLLIIRKELSDLTI